LGQADPQSRKENVRANGKLGVVDDELLKWNGFDDAILGVGSRCGMEDVLVYSKKKMAYILRDKEDMNVEEAIEYLDFNVLGAYIGERTPIVVEDFI
tara:strand:- start:2747 stop:3037 length:291 start_codon:yes stop_codon:yes gene_type:complete